MVAMQLASPGGWPLRGNWRALAFCVLLVSATSACDLRTYTFGGGDDDAGDGGATDGGAIDDGGGDDDGGPADAAPPDGCVAFPETCDGEDNDCDGLKDEDFDLTQNPAHCGACNHACAEPNTLGTCESSQCVYACAPGFLDTDDNLNNGCEYFCTPTNNGVERCDFADNDCDNIVDEDVDKNTVENCGTCGHQCFALNAEPVCNAGVCGAGDCLPGYQDVIPQIPGCEYVCPVDPPVAETCNGVDEDCDGTIDELPIDGLGDVCADPGYEAQMGVGRCTAGTRACSFGVEVCQGFVRPLADDSACNSIDDDCDGRTDEDVDFLNDPRHCGGCTACNLDNAVEGCSAGSCTVVACANGFVDLDHDPATGCEYACTPSGPETCDGRDNDCDGLIDLDDPDLTAPANFCRTLGACAGTTPTCAPDACTGDIGWTCEYGGNVETDACGDLPLQEASCDNLDGDCDGQTDESFTGKGSSCSDTGVGVCRRTGSLACNTAHTGLACNLTSPVVQPSAEVCDNEDDDCDGRTDEGAPDEMVPVQNGATTFYIYKYEASRPDASATGLGSASHRSCSKPSVFPWRNVTKTQAEAACAAAGKRLCTEAEWELSCGGTSGLAFPYGDVYDADACNGRDVDLDCTAPDSDAVAVTGRSFSCPAAASSACVSPSGAIDMSGNLREWTSTAVGTGSFRVRGGGYDNIEEGLRCDFSFIAFTPDTAFPNLGFRCCADSP